MPKRPKGPRIVLDTSDEDAAKQRMAKEINAGREAWLEHGQPRGRDRWQVWVRT